MRLSETPIWGTLLLSLGCFWVTPLAAFLTSIQIQRRRDRAEAEAMAAEGYPPPGPPTTDIQLPEE